MSGGRPVELTAEIQIVICDAIGRGLYMAEAAAVAGISKETLYDWVRRGARAKRKGRFAAGELPFITFSDAVKRSLAELQVNFLDNIHNAAGNGVWQAAAWLLERRFQGKWGRDRSLITELIREVRALKGGTQPARTEAAGPG